MNAISLLLYKIQQVKDTGLREELLAIVRELNRTIAELERRSRESVEALAASVAHVHRQSMK